VADLNLAQLDVPDWLAIVTPDELSSALETTEHYERWKYTPASKVLGLLPGMTSSPLFSGLDQPGVSVAPTTQAEAADLMYDRNAPEAFIAACIADQVLCIDVSKSLSVPITMSHNDSTIPVIIRLADNVHAELHEFSNAAIDAVQLLFLDLGPGSSLQHSRQSFEEAALHWDFLHAAQDRMSTYTLHNHSLGATLKRQDIHVTLAGEGAQFELKSAAYAHGNHTFDQQITIQHTAAHTTSRQYLNNIAADKSSMTCNGRIHIHPNAPHSDADLANRNLALGTSATVNTKPELEIYTDDVKCSHGATVGQLSEEAIFYCTSRGIPLAAAQRMLSKGFLLENVDGPLKEKATQALTDALMKSTGAIQ
jgi:Fe-S cluster assembly scaffold protein SufB